MAEFCLEVADLALVVLQILLKLIVLLPQAAFHRNVLLPVLKLVHLLLQTLDPKSVPFDLAHRKLLLPYTLAELILHHLQAASLLLEYKLKLSVPRFSHLNLALHLLHPALQLVNSLQEPHFFIFLLANLPLQISPVLLLIHSNRLECLDLMLKLGAVIINLLALKLQSFNLLCQMVDVSLEGQDLLDVVVFLLSLLLDG